MPRRARVPLFLVAVLFGGCVFKSQVPESAVIKCGKESDCPSGLRCQVQIRRCVDSSLYDVVPPGIAPGSEQLFIRPDRDNPLGAPTALGRAATLNVVFTATELLGAVPQLQGACPLACAPVEAAVPNYAFDCRLTSAAVTDGPCPLSAHLVDRAGLDATVPLGPVLTVDVTAPAPPATAISGLVTWKRIPWGAESTAGVPTDLIVGGSGSAPEATQVAVRSAGVTLGTADVDGGAFGPLALASLDNSTLEVSSIDAAGNASAWVNVHDAHWVATMGGKIAGRDAPNPNRFVVVGAHGFTARRADATELGEAAGLGREDSVSATVGGAASWSNIVGQRGLAFGKDGARAIYAAGFGRVFRFGGSRQAAGFTVGDTSVYAFDGRGWVELSRPPDPEADGNPIPRRWAGFVFDELANRLLVQGGETVTDGEVLGDLWALQDGSWRYLGEGPKVTRAATVWDTRRARLLVIGGRQSDGGLSGATWAWGGAAWTVLDAGIRPREGATAIHDVATGTSWVFGGADDAGTLADLWRFDGQKWVQQQVGASVPPPRWNPEWAWDPRRRVGVLKGGYSAASSQSARLSDAWGFDGVTWKPVPAGPSLEDATLTWYASRDQLVYAGTLGSSALPDTWVGTSDGGFAHLSPAYDVPPEGLRPALACAADAGCVSVGADGGVLRLQPGGWNAEFDLWSGSGLSPSALGWNPVTGQLMLVSVGSDGGALWSTRGPAGALLPAAPVPAFTPGTTPQLVAAGDGFLLVSDYRTSGVNVVAAWRPDAGWAPASPVSSADWVWLGLASLGDGGVLTLGAAVASTAVRVFADERGGPAPAWTPGPVPAPDFSLGAVCTDRRRKSVFHFGGVLNPPPSIELYERAPAGSWKRVRVSDPEGDLGPGPRVSGSCAWDEPGRRNILVGGSASAELIFGSGPLQSVYEPGWALHVAGNRPAAYFYLQLSPLAVPAAAQLKRLRLRAVAGATGQSLLDDSAVHGFRWNLSYFGAWVEAKPGQVAPGSFAAPSPDEVLVDDPLLLEAMMRGRSELIVALVPEGFNGTDYSQLAVDYVEATLELALP